jgi:DNA polymerase-3 subunit alpha
MTSDFDDTDRLAIEITECQHMGIDVLPPNVNQSFEEFAVVPGSKQIRFGMGAIKNVGSGAVEEIIRARTELGKFESLEQFLATVNPRVVNRKAMESLIKAGAFDDFGDRSTLLHNLETMLAFASRLQKQAGSGQVDLFGELIEDPSLKAQLTLDSPLTKYDAREQLLWERELLGLYLSQHPLELFATYLEEQTVPLSSLLPEHDNRAVVIGGAIVDVREITTKNGQKMAFVKIEDTSGDIEAILFPGAFQQTLGLWERDRVVLVRGRLSAKDRDGNMGQELKVLVDDAREITPQQAEAYQPTGKKAKLPSKSKKKVSAKTETASLESTGPQRVYIRLANGDDHELLMSLKQTIDEQAGDNEVVLIMGPDASKQIIRLPSRVSTEAGSLSRLQELVGADNIKLQ